MVAINRLSWNDKKPRANSFFNHLKKTDKKMKFKACEVLKTAVYFEVNEDF